MRCAICFVAVFVCFGIWAQENDPDVEPPHEFYIEIGEKKVDVEAGKAFKLDVSKEQELVLKQKPDRFFNRCGISFRFPQEYSYDFNNNKPAIWSLKGKQSIVIIQFYKDEIPEAIFPVFLKSLEVQYKNQAKTTDVTETLGSTLLSGKSIEPHLTLSAKIVQSVYPIKLGDNTAILLIQHTQKNNGTLKPESEALMKLLKETFKVEEKK